MRRSTRRDVKRSTGCWRASPQRRGANRSARRLANSQSFSDWIAGLAPPQLALAAAVAALLVMLQAAAIGALVLERAGAPTYQTAGGEQTTGESFDLLVGFADTATMGDIAALLKRLDAVVVDGPRAGLYRLRLPDKAKRAARPRSRLCISRGW